MQKIFKSLFVVITLFILIFALILKFNICNLAYQTVFFTNKNVSISDIKVNSEPAYKQDDDNNKKRIYPATINTFYLTKIQIGKQIRYIKVSELKKDKYININIISFKNKKLKRENYHLYLLHNKFPELIIENKGINKGYIFTTYTPAPDMPAHAFIMDMKGDVVFYKTSGMHRYNMLNFQKWKTKNNKVFYSLHERFEQKIGNIYKEQNNNIVLDKKFNVIDTVKTLATSKHPELDADKHDFIFLDKNHYIVQSSWIKKITKNSYTFSYIDSVIQEIKDGKVIFDWVASEHGKIIDNNFVKENVVIKNREVPEYILHNSNSKYKQPVLIDESLETKPKNIKIQNDSVIINDNYKKCAFGQCEEFYLNSIAIDPLDNNLLVSYRYKNAVIKIDRNTGEVLWQLGGLYDDFNLAKEEKFKLQHHAHFEQNDILYVFDNASHNPSRIIKYYFDKEHKNIIKKEFIDLNDYVYFMGSAQGIDDDKMIVSYANSLKYAINIIDSKGNIYWQSSFKPDIIEIRKDATIYSSIYRAYYYEKID